MFKLAGYLKDFKKYVILGPMFKLMEAIFELIVPIVMADIIDNGINGANASVSYVLWRGGILLLLAVVGIACSLTCQFFAAKCSQGFGTVLRNDLFRHINTLSYAELDDIGTPSMITRMTADINQLQVAVAMLIRLVIRAPFLVIGAAVMAMIINLKLSLVFIAVAPLIAIALYFIMSRTVPLYSKIQQKLDKVSLITRENLSGVRVVRAFAEQDNEQARFDESANQLAKASIRAGRISALLNPLTFVIINVAVLCILYFGGGLVNMGEMTQGEIIAFVNYLSQISLALAVVANLVIIYTKSAASAKRINEVFDTESSVKETVAEEVNSVSGAPRIEFDRVSFGYSKDGMAVKDLSFSLAAGETLGIIGGTGSGKSTVINLIPRFYDASEGSILIDGVNVKDYPLKQLRKKIGIVPQKSVLFKGTIRSNLLWANENATDEELWRALETAQAADFVREKNGLDTIVNQKGKNFSGGQRQRLAIARALAAKPDILILDDSTSALDFATDAALRKAINADTDKETSKIIVSQRATSIKQADIIVVLDHGEVAGVGKHKELLNSCAVYKEICLSQVSKEESEL